MMAPAKYLSNTNDKTIVLATTEVRTIAFSALENVVFCQHTSLIYRRTTTSQHAYSSVRKMTENYFANMYFTNRTMHLTLGN